MRKRSLLLLGAAVAVSMTACGTQKAAEETTSAAAAESGIYTPGTYTGTAEGYNGPVALDVTFSDSAITDIQIKNNHGIHTSDPVVFRERKNCIGFLFSPVI